jgi:hypothetical protein
MDIGPLVGAVTAAHRQVGTRLSAVEGAAALERADCLTRLSQTVHATADAEEALLFPAFRMAMGGDGVLAETCAAEHRELGDRLDALTSHPESPGFPTALRSLADDLRNHQADEVNVMLPVLAEALGEEHAAELAASFGRAVFG